MSDKSGITFDAIVDEMEVDLSTEVVFLGISKEAKIPVKRLLGYKEAMEFVDDIVAQCTYIDGCVYRPEVFDFSVKMNTLVHYAGFKKSGTIESAYSVIYCTDLYEVIRVEIDDEQYMSLVSAAKEKINNNREIMNNLLIAKMNEENKGEEEK